MKKPEMRFIWRFIAETEDGNLKLMPDSGNYGHLSWKLKEVGIVVSLSTIYRLKEGYNREYVCNCPELSQFAEKILGSSTVYEWRIQIGKEVKK